MVRTNTLEKLLHYRERIGCATPVIRDVLVKNCAFGFRVLVKVAWQLDNRRNGLSSRWEAHGALSFLSDISNYSGPVLSN